jgi:putative ABC transport system permease protein
MNLDQMLVLKGPGLTSFDSTFFLTAEAFKNELKALPHVKGVAITDRDLGQDMARAFNVRREGDDPNNKHTIRNYGASYEFLKTYDIPLASGRDFLPTDYHYSYQLIHNVILNESAVHMFGFTSNQDAVGKRLLFYGNAYDIVGAISVKVDPNDLPATISAIKAKYQSFFPGNVFSYYFMDEKFNKDYEDDNLFGKVFGIFAGFAIFVACLGLLGLALFATAQRFKEIGVRKVLGASVGSIVLLLSRDFIRLVLLAILVAVPIAWYVMHHWLQNFTYRIDISAWVFVASGLLAVVIALATISFQTLRAALANPVKSLRTE